jgi:hypothetical protein
MCLSHWLSPHVPNLRICQALLVFKEPCFSAKAIKIVLKLTGEQLNGWMTCRSSRHQHNCLLFLYLKDPNSEKLKIYSNLTSLSLLLCRAVTPSTRKGNIPLHVQEQIYPCARELVVRVHLRVVKRSLLMKNL